MNNLSDYAHSNLFALSTEVDAFLLIKNNQVKRRINIPCSLKKDPVIAALRQLVNSYYLYGTLSPGRLDAHFQTLFHFLECFTQPTNQLNQEGEAKLPLDTGHKFVRHLINKGFSESTIFNHVASIKILFQHLLSAKCHDVVNPPITTWRRTSALLECWPFIPKPEKQNSRQGLAEKFGINCSENHMLMSLKLFCVWFINECALIRKDFKAHRPADYDWLLSQSRTTNVWMLKEPVTTNDTQKDPAHLGREIYARMLRAAQYIASPLYLEAVFFNGYLKTLSEQGGTTFKVLLGELMLEFPNPAIRYGEWNREKILLFFETFVNSSGLAYRRTIMRPEKRLIVTPKKLFAPIGLLVPSVEEQMALAWLLASERVQLSNLERLRVSDVEWVDNRTRIHISTFKGRNNTTVSCRFANNQPAFEAIAHYHEALAFGYQNDLFGPPQANEDALFLPDLKYHHFALHQNKHCALLFLPMIVRGSSSQAAFFDFCKATHSTGTPEHFLDCLLRSFELNAEFSTFRSKHKSHTTHGNNTCQNTDAHTTEKTASVPGSLYLCPQNIAQSCVLGGDVERAVKSLNDLKRSADMAVKHSGFDLVDRTINAKKMRHSLATETQYADFSTCRIKLQTDDRFGELVGAEMFLMAHTLAQRMAQAAHIISLNDVGRLLNLNSQHSEYGDDPSALVLEQAELQHYVIDKVGLFSKKGHTVVVKIPLVAALLEAKTQHIEQHLSLLISDNPLQVKKTVALLIFYKSLLYEFDPVTRRRAKELYGHFTFEFSDLTA